MNERIQLVLFAILAAVVGISSVIFPYIATYGTSETYEVSAPLFPLLVNSWEKLQPVVTGVILFGAGLVLGFVKPKFWKIIGASTTLFFIIAALIEMMTDLSSHSLFPIEFVLYFVFIGGPATIGTFTGSKIRKSA